MSVPTFDPDAPWSPAGDFEAVADGMEAVTIADRDGNATAIEKVLRRAIRRSEVAPSNGYYRADDTVFHLSTTEYEAQPGLGWTIATEDRGTFTVLGVHREALGDRWKCVARNLEVTEGLDQRVAVLRYDRVQGADGEYTGGYVATEESVLARVQVILAERTIEGGRSVFPERATIVFQAQRGIGPVNAILDRDGRAWKIVKAEAKDRIDVLFQAEGERTPWPLS